MFANQNTLLAKDLFFLEKEKVEQKIEQINTQSIFIKKIIDTISLETNSMLKEKNESILNHTCQQVSTSINDTQMLLKLMIESTNGNELKENICKKLTKKLLESSHVFFTYYGKYQQQSYRLLKKELSIIYPDENIDNIIQLTKRSGMTNKVFFNLFVSEEHTEAADRLRHNRELYQDVIELEEKLKDLKVLFNDFSLLVFSQQEQFDSIEHHINKAKSSTTHGAKQLEEAEERQVSSNVGCCRIL